jgi:hypothetical protein
MGIQLRWLMVRRRRFLLFLITIKWVFGESDASYVDRVRVRLKNAYIPCVVGYPLVLP